MPKIILVANSEHVKDINSQLSSEDILVRFNAPKSTTIQKTGGRTNYVFLANTVNLLQGRIRKGFHRSKLLKCDDVQLVFPYSDQLIQQINPYFQPKALLPFMTKPEKQNNWDNAKYVDIFKAQGVETSILSESIYYQAQRTLEISNEHIISTGLLALFYFLNHPDYKTYQIYLNGFSFQGWKGHDWQAEQNYVERLLDEGKIQKI